MKQAADPTTHSRHGKNPDALGTLAMDLLDTAWRIAIPVVAAAVLGIVMDRSLGTRPWMTLVASVAGLGVAGWLVKRQLAAVEQEDRA